MFVSQQQAAAGGSQEGGKKRTKATSKKAKASKCVLFFFSHAPVLGECSTVHSLPVVFLFLKWRLARPH